MKDRRFLSAAAPQLPLKECACETCECRYAHHDDRRAVRDRRANFANLHIGSMTERRASTGRRVND